MHHRFLHSLSVYYLCMSDIPAENKGLPPSGLLSHCANAGGLFIPEIRPSPICALKEFCDLHRISYKNRGKQNLIGEQI